MNIKLKSRDSHINVLFILMAALLGFMLLMKGSTYFTVNNLRSMIFQFPEYGILALGMMICMIAGGIDLSLVGIMNLSGVLAALLIKNEILPIPLAVVFGIVFGGFCGLLNGTIIAKFNIPAMLVTLCGLELYSGLALAITGGPAINDMPDAFKNIANGSLGPIPYVLFIFIIVTLIIVFVMKYTIYGREVQFLGSNVKAAKYSGIDVDKIIMITYTISGLLGGLSGILISSHLNSAKSSNGSTYTLLSLLIVVLGGISPDGGKGRVVGVTLSIILVQMIANAFIIMKAPDSFRIFVNGSLLILALILDRFLKERALQKVGNK